MFPGDNAVVVLEIGDSAGTRLINRDLGGGYPNYSPVTPSRDRVAGKFVTKECFANPLGERLLDAIEQRVPVGTR
jgi:hypothetical protein